MSYQPGEIYWADLDSAGFHPVVVVSRQSLNRGQSLLAVLITSANYKGRSGLANSVAFHAGEFGLSKDCVAKCEDILLLETVQLDATRGLIGKLNDTAMRDVIKAIGYVIDANCEPV